MLLKGYHTEVVSPVKERTIGKYKYIVTLLGEYSGYWMVKFISYKSETPTAVIQMIREIENIFIP